MSSSATTSYEPNADARPDIGNDLAQLRVTCLLVDVRTPGEFRTSNIEGSINVPLPDVVRDLDALRSLAGTRAIALVCRTGKRARSAEEALRKCDCGELHVLEGGVVAWEKAGLPLQRGEAAIPLDRQTSIAAGTVILSAVLLGTFVHPGAYAVAGAVGGGLIFAGLTGQCALASLLARMPWNRAPKLADG